ncbi:MAG: STELLO glycosyltransferase family protein, partial [Silvanigrellaceae bacterium]|nr:STELLO glycosyltransferase family protein [Silvanigrellaceae bacterium]
RGFPLACVASNIPIQTHERMVKISVQQGVVDRDPDVDAIFRLTQPQEVYFEKKETPLALAPKTFAPFNSQNTLFYRSAFWALLLPVTTTFRECDIWRSYWTERLLHDLGLTVGYLSPAVEQMRNEHDLFKDFLDEVGMYVNSARFIKDVQQWNSEESLLDLKMLNLMGYLIDRGYFKKEELAFVKAWIADLKAVGYSFEGMLECSK